MLIVQLGVTRAMTTFTPHEASGIIIDHVDTAERMLSQFRSVGLADDGSLTDHVKQMRLLKGASLEMLRAINVATSTDWKVD
jgi:hypothetical protein